MPAPLASDYALPAYAQVQPTDEVSFMMTSQSQAGVWDWVADGAYVYVIVALQVSITTDATAGNRLFQIAHFDANLSGLSNVPASAVQPPNTITVYSASATASGAYAVGTTAMMLPLPAIPLTGGMRLRVGFFPTDTFPAPFLTALRYSTARIDVPVIEPTATPLLG